ncbi:MAG TPA: polyprenyl diphosphate synthase [Halanaerobiales bacterium]|nr:polyprenyl diphosphate synthase [Halanaerobiales bacterium]
MQNLPSHIAIIMDGNGRWAQSKNKPRTYGHKKGVDTLKTMVEEFIKKEIPSLTVYAFSTENWKRPPKEVQYLMTLFRNTIENEAEELDEQDVKVNIIGRRDKLDSKLLETIEWIEELTKDNKKLELNIAFNYGGRAEIIDVVKKIKTDSEISRNDIDEKLFNKKLYNPNISNVEYIIRTGGEKRISNFLLWESAYAELYFTEKYWPEFDKKELEKALKDFSNRKRKFGALDNGADN